jgi:hypothetical protein
MMSETSLPTSVAAYREKHLKRWPSYSSDFWGIAHYLFVMFVGLSVSGYSLSFVTDIKVWEVTLFPLGLILGNIAVYIIHKYILHREWKFFPFPFHEHTIKHHSYYTHDAIVAHRPSEYKHILFLPAGIIGFVAGLGIPLAYLFYVTLSPNAGFIIMAMSVLYFLLYETCHLICHLPENHFIFKLSFFWMLREHHRLHHDKSLMKEKNFNIVFPLADWLFGDFVKSSSKSPQN